MSELNTKANIKVITWTYNLDWKDYLKMIKGVSFNLADKFAKEAFEKYSSIVVDGNDGCLIMGKSRVTDTWVAMENNLRNYQYNPATA